MAVVFMTDPATGRCALYDEPSSAGAADNPNAARNAPLNNPTTNLQYLYFHSDLDYMEVSHGPTNAGVGHPAVPAAAAVPGQAAVVVAGGWFNSTVLLTHNLGYVPDFFVVRNGDIVYPGTNVQYEPSDGRARFVTVYATATQIVLYEWALQTGNVLAGSNQTYTVVVFRQPPAPSGNILLDFNPATGIVRMGREKFNSSRRYLQVTPGGTSYGFALGKTIDLNNGAPRYVDPDGSIVDPLLPIVASKIIGINEPNDAPFGPSMRYLGSFTGSPSILVSVP